MCCYVCIHHFFSHPFRYRLISHAAVPKCGSVVKNLPAYVGDTGLIPGLGRSLRVGNGNSLQYSCLENSIDRGAWWITVHGVTKSWTRLSPHSNTHTQYLTAEDRDFRSIMYRRRRDRGLGIHTHSAYHSDLMK